jgi:hypothetical protein
VEHLVKTLNARYTADELRVPPRRPTPSVIVPTLSCADMLDEGR